MLARVGSDAFLGQSEALQLALWGCLCVCSACNWLHGGEQEGKGGMKELVYNCKTRFECKLYNERGREAAEQENDCNKIISYFFSDERVTRVTSKKATVGMLRVFCVAYFAESVLEMSNTLK